MWHSLYNRWAASENTCVQLSLQRREQLSAFPSRVHETTAAHINMRTCLAPRSVCLQAGSTNCCSTRHIAHDCKLPILQHGLATQLEIARCRAAHWPERPSLNSMQKHREQQSVGMPANNYTWRIPDDCLNNCQIGTTLPPIKHSHSGSSKSSPCCSCHSLMLSTGYS
jgi:hypothetical protein